MPVPWKKGLAHAAPWHPGRALHGASSAGVRAHAPAQAAVPLHTVKVGGRRVAQSGWAARRSAIARQLSKCIDQLAPVWKGALRVFLPQASASTRLVPQHAASRFGSSFVNSGRAPQSRLAHFANVRARLPRGPGLVPMPSHGAGLQSARTFCSGGPGARLFENAVTNAPLALRAAGCSFEDDSVRSKGDATPAFAYAMRVQRWGVKCSMHALNVVHTSMNRALRALSERYEDMGAEDEADAVLSEAGSFAVASADLDLLFPASAPEVPSPYARTRLRVPLDPDLSMVPGPRHQRLATDGLPPLLDDMVKTDLQLIRAAYQDHALKVSHLETLLRKQGLWPHARDLPKLLVTQGDGLSARTVLEICLDGWSTEDVSRVLDPVGDIAWVAIEEDTNPAALPDQGGTLLDAWSSDDDLGSPPSPGSEGSDSFSHVPSELEASDGDLAVMSLPSSMHVSRTDAV